MIEPSLNEKIKKLVAKFNSIQGTLLSYGKRITKLEELDSDTVESIEDLYERLKALEEKPTVESVGLGITLNPKFKKWYSEVFPDEEVETDKKEVIEETEKAKEKALAEIVIADKEEEVIDPETLEALDEIVED